MRAPSPSIGGRRRLALSGDSFITTSFENPQTQGNGDVTGSLTYPTSFQPAEVGDIGVVYRGRFKTLEEIADMIGKPIEEIVSVVLGSGEASVIVKNVAQGVLLNTAGKWVIRKLGLGDNVDLALSFVSGDGLVPLYKPQFDENREAYLGRLHWSGVGMGKFGVLTPSPNQAAEDKTVLLSSPDKNAPVVNWDFPILVERPETVMDFYIEGLQISDDMNDAGIRLNFLDEGEVPASSPEAKLTVYDFQFMMVKDSAYADPADFASKVEAGVLSDGDFEEVESLRAGKWENAFTSGGSLRANFVERDPDQFVMRLRGFGSGNPAWDRNAETALADGSFELTTIGRAA